MKRFRNIIPKRQSIPPLILKSRAEGFPENIDLYACWSKDYDNLVDDQYNDIIDEEVTGFIIPNNDYWTYEKKLDCLLHDCDMQEKMYKNILSITNRFSINNIMGKWKNELDNLI